VLALIMAQDSHFVKRTLTNFVFRDNRDSVTVVKLFFMLEPKGMGEEFKIMQFH